MTNDAKGERLAVVMFNPPHPGLTLRDDVLPELGLTVTQAAQFGAGTAVQHPAEALALKASGRACRT